MASATESKWGLPECLCGNSKFLCYYSKSSDDPSSIIGICCRGCYQEWVEDRFLMTPDGDESRPGVEICGVILKMQFKSDVHDLNKSIINQLYRIQPTDVESYLNVAKIGDHIAWKRPYFGVWHHAIVSGISNEVGCVQVIHWDTEGGKLKNVFWKSGRPKARIKEKWLDLRNEKGTLHRVQYPLLEGFKPHHAQLVIARAKSRINDVGYDLASDNCETFAYHCKTGLLVCKQIKQLKHKRKEKVTNTLVKFAETVSIVDTVQVSKYPKDCIIQLNAGTISFENPENDLRRSQNIVKLPIEGVYCLWDLTEIYERRKKPKTDSKDFNESACKEVSKVLYEHIFTFSRCLPCFNMIIILISAVMIAVYAGMYMEVAIRTFGVIIVVLIGLVILAVDTVRPYLTRTVMKGNVEPDLNDALVRSKELSPGDLVVLYQDSMHEGRYAIVDTVNTSEKKFTVGPQKHDETGLWVKEFIYVEEYVGKVKQWRVRGSSTTQQSEGTLESETLAWGTRLRKSIDRPF